jgi:hypothetical protein
MVQRLSTNTRSHDAFFQIGKGNDTAMEKLLHWTLTAFMILAIAACNGGGGDSAGGNDNGSDNSGTVPKGNRILEIQPSEAADGDFAGAFNLAQTAGMQSASLALDWNAIDIGTDNGSPVYADDPDTDFLAIANACYPNSNTKLSLQLMCESSIRFQIGAPGSVSADVALVFPGLFPANSPLPSRPAEQRHPRRFHNIPA